MTERTKRRRTAQRESGKSSGFWGEALELFIDAGDVILTIIIWPFRIFGRMLGAILEGLAD